MDFKATRIPYRQANAFSKITLDYIDQVPALKNFYSHLPNLTGIQKAIESRKNFPTNRELLVKVLKTQYRGKNITGKLEDNINALLSPDTFTVTTAHQNNIFTGPIYFIYKIIHAIKLADHLKEMLPGYQFVPVFYIGTEDADIDELNHIQLGGEKLEWKTKQAGAVGRMKIDKDLLKLIDKMEGQLMVLPHGNEITGLLRRFYQEGSTIQEATFDFVNELFAGFGLVILLPDNADLKKQMQPVFEDDLLNETASHIVARTTESLHEVGYKIQANPREINLFYMENGIRERIEKIPANKTGEDKGWRLADGSRRFSKNELLSELELHPERFSPNVILRGLYQETILPNIAFIGGGGETAYWLQLKTLFEHYKIPFPVLVLRNSFLIVEEKWNKLINHLGFQVEDFFLSEQELINHWVKRESKIDTKLNGSLTELEKIYDVFRKQASAVDLSLEKHVDSLKLRTVSRLQELEKKMMRAEKRKYTDQQRQIHKIKSNLFPGDGLQERYENLSFYYALWGIDFIQKLYEHSLSLDMEFTVAQTY